MFSTTRFVRFGKPTKRPGRKFKISIRRAERTGDIHVHHPRFQDKGQTDF